jgi:hypothetical protein
MCVLGWKTVVVSKVRLFGPRVLTTDPKTGLTVITDRAAFVTRFMPARDLGDVVALAPGASGLDQAEVGSYWTVLGNLGKTTGY